MCLCITPQILYAQRSIRPVQYLRSQQLTTYHIRIHMYLCITPQILYAKRLICPVKCLRIQFVTVNIYICMYTYLCLCYSSRTLCAMIVAHRVYFCLKRQHITICTYICIYIYTNIALALYATIDTPSETSQKSVCNYIYVCEYISIFVLLSKRSMRDDQHVLWQISTVSK